MSFPLQRPCTSGEMMQHASVLGTDWEDRWTETSPGVVCLPPLDAHRNCTNILLN